jgi:hypothetical protein
MEACLAKKRQEHPITALSMAKSLLRLAYMLDTPVTCFELSAAHQQLLVSAEEACASTLALNYCGMIAVK